MEWSYKPITDYIKELLYLLKEVILFAIHLPVYLAQFLKGLRIFSKSYEGLLKGLEAQQKFFDQTKGKNASTTTIANIINEIIRLKYEQEKMFNQLFSIFIATVALIVSILTLVVNK